MKYLKKPQVLILFGVIFVSSLMLPQSADARVGERRQTFENRLFGSGGAAYNEPEALQSRMQRMPYRNFLDLLPSSAELKIYHKTADGSGPRISEMRGRQVPSGWDVHIIFLDSRSVMEIYKRSRAMTDAEVNNLLSLSAEGSFWKRVERAERLEAISAFDFDMLRADGAVRARRMGNDTLLFVETEVDISLAKRNEAEQQRSAPVSVKGF